MLLFKRNTYVLWYNLTCFIKNTIFTWIGETNVHFCQRLKDLREDNEKTQAEIAELLGTTRQQYSKWETGVRKMPIDHYRTLAKFYNVSLDYLTGLTDTSRKLR